MNNLSLSAYLEAILFVRGEPVARAELMRLIKTDVSSLESALQELKNTLQGRGLTLLDDGREVELRTAAQANDVIEEMRKEELSRDIGKAGLETLAILLYKGPATRSEIDFIRGVNSSHILRSLTMRGLVRKTENPADERSFLYEPTTELLAHLGASTREEIPEFASVTAELQKLIHSRQERQEAEAPNENHE